MKLGSKGLFTISFASVEDIEGVFEKGPYFFNFVGLYLRIWTKNLIPEKEYFIISPLWIQLYLSPQEFWDEEILVGIGNTLGSFVQT
jgi:hypothetical protein